MITIPSILTVLLLVAPADASGGLDSFRLDSFPLRGWRFTTERPPEGWEREGFDDSRWKEGEPGFGNRGLPPVQQAKVKTPWNEPEIWTRAVLDLDGIPEIPERLAIRWSHDEDAEVHLNGVLAAQAKGHITHYEIVLLEGEARKALRAGKNTIAAHCLQTAGGQFLDVGFVEARAPERRSVDSILAELGVVPRPEHPRPDRLRPRWLNLNGAWEFAFDPEDRGLKEGWWDGRALASRIVVPFAPESLLSGVRDEELHVTAWYARSFDLPDDLRGRRILLHFGAVDYRAEVWLNGRRLGMHEGGYDPFAFDVTDLVRPERNRLIVRAHDDPREAKPHGKQCPERFPSGCVYMRVTGIWQTVWLEAVGKTYVRDWVAIAAPDGAGGGRLELKAETDGAADGLRLVAAVSRDGVEIARGLAPVEGGAASLSIAVPGAVPWSPESPVLYDIDLELRRADGSAVDDVRTYVGFRTIEARDGKLLLNGRPLFWISALDQGYWPDGLYTPRTDDLQRGDVAWARRYGLNGIRKHQIVAEPRFYYWCDRLGLTVWEEMPDWGADPRDTDRFLREWLACVRRDRNHPSVIAWVPSNEQTAPDEDAMNRAKVRLHDATRALDPTRPALDTSGYCHAKTDIVDLHVNPRDGEDCRRWWRDWRRSVAETGNFLAWPGRPAYAKGSRHEGQPVVISETGNWWIAELPPDGPWAPYGAGPVPTVEAFLALYRDFFMALMAEPECAGFSYVQLYDVEGEVNGYLTYDRRPKVPPEAISGIHAEGLRRRAEGAESPKAR